MDKNKKIQFNACGYRCNCGYHSGAGSFTVACTVNEFFNGLTRFADGSYFSHILYEYDERCPSCGGGDTVWDHKPLFILGAVDLEMKAIEKLLSERKLAVAYAAAPGCDGNITRCHPGNAGKFTDILSPDGEKIEVKKFGPVVLVECAPAEGTDFPEVVVVDHHKPGDPGFGKSPAEFEAGSSLGQVAQLLGVTLTKEQLAIAAADHCLTAAYQGECPGISQEDILAVRLPELMARHRMSEDDVREEIKKAVTLLENPQKTVLIGDQEVPDFRDNGILPFMVEAGTMTGKSFLAHVDSRPGFEQKVMLNGDAATVSAFLDGAADFGIVDTYGNPNRGFAGGTQQ